MQYRVKRGEMTAAKEEYLLGLGVAGRETLRRDAIQALRHAWPHRHDLRGRIVVQANVDMLRHLNLV